MDLKNNLNTVIDSFPTENTPKKFAPKKHLFLTPSLGARNVVKITLPTEMDAISTEVMHTIQAGNAGDVISGLLGQSITAKC